MIHKGLHQTPGGHEIKWGSEHSLTVLPVRLEDIFRNDGASPSNPNTPLPPPLSTILQAAPPQYTSIDI